VKKKKGKTYQVLLRKGEKKNFKSEEKKRKTPERETGGEKKEPRKLIPNPRGREARGEEDENDQGRGEGGLGRSRRRRGHWGTVWGAGEEGVRRMRVRSVETRASGERKRGGCRDERGWVEGMWGACWGGGGGGVGHEGGGAELGG